ncbi:hypothetical protein CDD80_1916 [Ophiocordyceps camponoti-rufipedis]|uniref:DUF7924 domain-containing protein n=1 Tax=Ophiocordyceps camponoti-rufipedis TaxID=2004952 RepID=A0A2C5Z975_9HYPO|nr:hypothetical protein CDD80_1916 [Ophiocordyceps camponoti-rufipedis]
MVAHLVVLARTWSQVAFTGINPMTVYILVRMGSAGLIIMCLRRGVRDVFSLYKEENSDQGGPSGLSVHRCLGSEQSMIGSSRLDTLLETPQSTPRIRYTYYMCFPFLTCEVKCGGGMLMVADRQNAHSMTMAATSPGC